MSTVPRVPGHRVPGRPAAERRRTRAEFGAHVLAYLKSSGLSFRQLCAEAFSGDDSNATYVRALEIVNGQAVPDGVPYRTRLARLVKATGWPKSKDADEPLPESR